MARAAAARRRASTARPSTSTSRSTTGPACSRASPRSWPSATISIARLLQHQNGDGAALHVVTHEAREGSLADALAAIAALRRGAQAAAAVPRRLRPWRRGARMGVIEPLRATGCRSAPSTPELTLGEGATPLVRSRGSSEQLGVELYFKFEGMNPTGSFKDRGMCVAVAKAVEDGAEGDRLRVDRQHRRVGRRLRRARRARRRRAARRPARSPRRSRRSRAPSARECSRSAARFDDALRVCHELAEPRRARARQLAQPAPHRGPEDRGVRDRRGARPRARRARAALRRRRQHASRTRRASPRRARRRGSSAVQASERATHARLGDPHRRARARSTRSTSSSPTAAPRSSRSTTTRSPTRGSRSRAARASSASRRRPPASRRSRTSSSSRAAPSSACSPATASRTRPRSTC